uniref:Uncharacterized protein n=1 Tax=Avena sativa TaxID=4498 RepID=A0ACD5WLW3_AVESA
MAALTSIYTTIMQLSDWEIQALILLSFALQLFLFFSGSLRRRHGHMLLRTMIWLSYLAADFVAVYALGYLSRNFPTTSSTEDNHHKPTHQLTLLWAPFLLIHLGGQDTVTAFSLEDNEMWLRHLLNLLCQACLVVYVLWKLVALAHHQLVIPAAFLFVSGVIKYGERIWALKLGSQKGLRTCTSVEVTRQFRRVEESERHSTYQAAVRHAALHTEGGVRDIFAGRKIEDMGRLNFSKFMNHRDYDEWVAQIGNAEVNFKRAEIELSIMYDNLFTKSRVIRTRPGAILRCVSLTSTVVAFVLYVNMMISSSANAEKTTSSVLVYNNNNNNNNNNYNNYRRSRVDAAITYGLFVGAFILEAGSFFIVMMSPWAWPFLGAQARWCSCVLLTRVVWPIFVRIQPETKAWWSNSMGQYKLVRTSSRIAGIFGAKELWNKIHNRKHVKITREIKVLIHNVLHDLCWYRVPESCRAVLRLPFEELLLFLHVWTEEVMNKADKSMMNTTETDKKHRVMVMDTCKMLSDYMIYLLVEHPAMLPVSTNVKDVVEATAASDWARNKEWTAYYGVPGQTFFRAQSALLGQTGGDRHRAGETPTDVGADSLLRSRKVPPGRACPASQHGGRAHHHCLADHGASWFRKRETQCRSYRSR